MESRLIGKIVSRRFRVEDVIGRGGMAIVYRAFDLKTHQAVAFKVLREEYEDDPESVSYTHLDVYKRQVRAEEVGRFPSWIFTSVLLFIGCAQRRVHELSLIHI